MARSLADPRTLAIACLAEAGLAAVGFGIGRLAGLPVEAMLPPVEQAPLSLALGLLASAPMVAFFFLLMRVRWAPLARLRRQVKQIVGELLAGARLPAVLTVAVAAGLGEEVLFRGALQPLLTEPLGAGGGLLAASLLFGLAHPMSLAYVLVASLGGLYLGAVTHLTGDLLVAITAHAVYDLVALLWLRRP